VHSFLDKSFELIEVGGVISFLLPSTILTSHCYNDIRKIIYNDFTIEELIQDVKFEGVSIQVCLLVIKKQKTSEKKFIIQKGHTYQITQNKINNSLCSTIKEFGYQVGIGQYCWSHYIDKLNNENNGPKLLYSTYIKHEMVVENNISNVKKKKYLNIENPKIFPNVIIFPRTTSKQVRMVLLINNVYVLENHVIYIKHNNVLELIKLYNYLNLNRNFIGIEMDSEYFNMAKNRIENHYNSISQNT
jgi:hypothetical protein